MSIYTNVGGQLKELQSIYTNVGGQLKEIQSGRVFKGTWHLDVDDRANPNKLHELLTVKNIKLPVRCTIEISNISPTFLYQEYPDDGTPIQSFDYGEIGIYTDITPSIGFRFPNFQLTYIKDLSYHSKSVDIEGSETVDLLFRTTSYAYFKNKNSGNQTYYPYKMLYFDYKIIFEKL